jgi:hypothetical protein
MGTVVGVVIGLFASLLGRVAGFDRDRAFYPTLLIVVASYYVLFAAMGGSTPALLAEAAVMTGFVAAAVAAFRWRLWIAAAGLIGHGVFDLLLHGRVVTNPGMPVWWPPFCAAFDITAGAILAALLVRSRSSVIGNGR